MTMLRAGGLLDVLTPLSDCRQEPVEKMERIISGVSYMCWIDFHNGILGCGFLCARLISFLFRRLSISRLPRQGLPRPIYTARATTSLPLLHSYHVCLYIPATTPRATTPHTCHQGLSRSTPHVHRVITPVISISYFVVFISPAFTPSLLLLHHHLAPHATTYSTASFHSNRSNPAEIS